LLGLQRIRTMISPKQSSHYHLKWYNVLLGFIH
jgi:hypothetical protein